MLRNMIRGYYKLRYFPRLVVQMHREVLAGVAGVSVSLDDERRRIRTDSRTTAARLEDVHAEVSSLCDDAARHMLAAGASSADLVQRVEALGRTLAGLNAELARQGAVPPPSLPDPTPRLDQLEALVRRQNDDIARVERRAVQQARLFPTNLWDEADGDRVRGWLRHLAPVAVAEAGFVRIGRALDGGYVMLDDLDGIAAALSLGIADDVSWDRDVAERGVDVHQFDPSVTAPPEPHERFRFEPLRVAAADGPGAISLDTIAARVPTGDLLLKMDIEGAEWDVLEAADDTLLARCRQVVCEFHDLDRLAEPAWGARAGAVWARLARTHHVVHVHGNNCGNFANAGNVVVPQSVEVTFALRSRYRAAPGTPTFPAALDRPNQPGRADLYLGTFRFGE